MIKNSQATQKDPLTITFLDSYITITKTFKRVFKVLQWYFQKMRQVFPSLEKIAQHAKCSISTVQNAIRFFIKLGWMGKMKCPYRSNQYFMDDKIIDLDLNDTSLFLREKLPENYHVLESSSKEKINISTTERKVSASSEHKNNPIPKCINIKGLADEDAKRLADAFSECALQEAVKDAKWYTLQGNQIDSLVGLIWSRAKHYTKAIRRFL